MAGQTTPLTTLLARAVSSPTTRTAATAAVTALAVILVAAGIARSKKQTKARSLKKSIPGDGGEENKLTRFGIALSAADEESFRLAARARMGEYDEEIILEQLSRTRLFLGDPGLHALRTSSVTIVGCGGVGSWTALMLLRSGITHLRLIDFDQVTLSSLNRHAVADLADVGTPKVHATRAHLLRIAPWASIDARVALWTLADAEHLLDGDPSYVVDAIDNIDTKVDLLAYCVGKGVRVVASMGAGCKSDPTRICIGDIADSHEDPLSRSTRRRLKMKGITHGIPTVYSTEKPGPGKATLTNVIPGGGGSEEEAAVGALPTNASDYSILPDFRIRILPVLGTMPALFGLCLANHILLSLSSYPSSPYPPPLPLNRHKLHADLLSSLTGSETRLRGNAPGIRVPLTEDDAGYILEEVFRGKSVVSGFPTRLALVRWERMVGEVRAEGDQPVGVGGVVVMTKEEAKKHEREVLVGGRDPVEVWGREVVERVEMRQREEKLFSVYR
ncbi:hypothetical protein DFH27DRAFT_563294 [Peziza echinospora]|nr:hypothetical protein DFH27DRAFT_563294 [Peziza echinospora]